MCALLTTVFVFMRMFYTCVLKRCVQSDILRSSEIYRTSKILTLMSTHLVQRRKKQLFYVCFNVCFKEM